MGRHAKRDNVLFLAEKFEIGRVVTFMAIDDKGAISTSSSASGMLIEMLDPFHAFLVCCPPVFSDRNGPAPG